MYKTVFIFIVTLLMFADSRSLHMTDCNADKEDAVSASQPSATSEDG